MAQPEFLAGFQAMLEYAPKHGGAAVALKLEDVLSGIGMRTLEVQGDAHVDGMAVLVIEGQVVGMTRLQGGGEQLGQQRVQRTAGNAYDAYATASGGSGDGDDGVMGAQGHGKATGGKRNTMQAATVYREQGTTMPYLIETFDKPHTQALRQALRDKHLDYLEENKALLLACGAKLDD